MVGERVRSHSQFLAAVVTLDHRPRKVAKPCIAFPRSAIFAQIAEAVRLVIGTALRHRRLHHPVALQVAKRAARCVDRDLVEIGRAETRLLRVEVAETAAPEEADRWRSRCPGGTLVGRNATCSVSAKKLSTFRLSVIATDQRDRHILFRDQLGRIEHVVGLRRGKFFVELLDRQDPIAGNAPLRSPRKGRGGGNPGRRRQS